MNPLCPKCRADGKLVMMRLVVRSHSKTYECPKCKFRAKAGEYALGHFGGRRTEKTQKKA